MTLEECAAKYESNHTSGGWAVYFDGKYAGFYGSLLGALREMVALGHHEMTFYITKGV